MKKALAQSEFGEEPQKPHENYTFLKNSIFGWFWGFFSELVSPIELILVSLVQCPLRTNFDRSLDRSFTTLMNGGQQGKFLGQTGPFFGLREFLIWPKTGGKTLKSVKHTKIWYLAVTKTFLGHFWPLLNFYPSKEHFQDNTGPNLDLV